MAYVADDRTIANGGGIIKYTHNGSTWSSAYTLGTTTGAATSSGARGLTVDWTGAAPILYATTTEDSTNRVIRIVDTGPGAGATLVATAPANTVFRGLDFAPLVGAPGAITQGNPAGTAVCANASGVTYTITNATGATGYNWTVPAGASITAGQGTTNVTVTWGSAGGDVSVTPTNYFGSGTSSSQTVTVVDPTAPVITCATNKRVEYTDAWTFDPPSATDPCGTNTHHGAEHNDELDLRSGVCGDAGVAGDECLWEQRDLHAGGDGGGYDAAGDPVSEQPDGGMAEPVEFRDAAGGGQRIGRRGGV